MKLRIILMIKIVKNRENLNYYRFKVDLQESHRFQM